MITDAFDLLTPSSGEGPTHLRTPERGGILCGDYRRRYATFTMAGIVPAGSATCATCNRMARALVAARHP